jgi:Peptidase family M49
MKRMTIWCLALLGTLLQLACAPAEAPEKPFQAEAAMTDIDARLAKYTPVRLTTDAELSDAQKQMIRLLIEAAGAMDDAFWLQAYGDKDALLSSLDDGTRRFAEMNYGPWDRLADNEPFVDGVGPKPAVANFYPQDVTKDEVETAAAADPAIKGLYTMVRRDEAGALQAIPYSEFFAAQYQLAAEKLRAAADLAEDAGFREYLRLRADALLSDDYYASDLAWMDMKSNTLDVVIGPIETYEDALLGAKASNEAYVLVKDKEWSQRLSKYAALLPSLQAGLPVPDEYKQDEAGTDSDLNAYDVLYYAGDCNAGSKTIAINLPNDERVQEAKGSRRLQLKNAIRAKFEKILEPIADELIGDDQRAHVTFDAFFGNTMFHEVAHGLGIKNVLDGSGTVRAAMQEHASALEEGKADVLGLYMVTALHARDELGDADLMDNYVTFLSSIFRSIRFSSASAHGRANLIRFNFFQEMGAFTRDEAGHYRIDPEKVQPAIDALSEKILRLQGDGDYGAVDAFVEQYGQEGPTLRADLDRLAAAGIPVDVVFEQGAEVLGL